MPDRTDRGPGVPTALFDPAPYLVSSPTPADRPRTRRRRPTPAPHPTLTGWLDTQVLLGQLARPPRDIVCGAARRKRERRHPCGLYIRKVQGRLFQLRIYMGGGRAAGQAWNLGLFRSEEAAAQVRRKWVEVTKDPELARDPCRALAALQKSGWVSPDILPLWVLRVPGGYIGRRKTRDGVTETRVFATPMEAHLAMKSLVTAAARRKLPARHRTGPVPAGTAAG